MPLAAKAEIINGSTLVPLRFVSEALGADVKWDDVNTVAIITSSYVPEYIPPGTRKVNGINVWYGMHDYKSGSQAEYDKVMEIVKGATAKYSDVSFAGEYEKYYRSYLDGDREASYPRNSEQSRGLTFADNDIGELVSSGVSKDKIEQVYKIAILAGRLLNGVRDPGDGSPVSAYDTLARDEKIRDRDSDAQVFSAVFDAMGYNTAIVAHPGYVRMVVKVDGTWFVPIGGSFTKITLPTASFASGEAYVRTAPTFK